MALQIMHWDSMEPVNPMSRWRLAKSASMKLKLGVMIDLMLIMKQREKACPCL